MKIIPNIKYKSVLTGLTIAQRNKAFDRLSDEGKRLEIAWDALQMVLNGFVKASEGCYWNNNLLKVEGDSKTLQKVFNTKEFYKKEECEVCQRGLMMLSQVRLGNSIDSTDLYRCEGSRTNIKGFDFYSFLDMEREYEYSYFNHPYFNNSQEKLANICCNVLVNGDFNKEDKTNYLTVIY